MKKSLEDSIQLFKQLGTVRSRSMFGGYGIFIDDTMFALFVNEKLHIRADNVLSRQYQKKGYKPYIYKKRGFPVITKYFAPPSDWHSDVSSILLEAKNALQAAKLEKKSQMKSKPDRLKDLPNLRLATERMLKKAGVFSVKKLEETGSVEAFKAIRKTHTTDVNLELLWALEGAIKGTHWSVIPKSRREELVNHLN
ncbi:DNA transformation protein [Candidatus Photodesmus blepharus]|uniref:DNA transformation protein n=1 Tax=Candidatus Photodesmus blepharonis TaxID=1179155 RepID=A0A084CPE4_9GAMM|nr:TfoX/Sxy family DNA transformation protein [Candidatus Photodesmus blepharus]KEY91673.1 DNA transformation protein [Candidatus Photodesmus blepharus]